MIRNEEIISGKKKNSSISDNCDLPYKKNSSISGNYDLPYTGYNLLQLFQLYVKLIKQHSSKMTANNV